MANVAAPHFERSDCTQRLPPAMGGLYSLPCQCAGPDSAASPHDTFAHQRDTSPHELIAALMLISIARSAGQVMRRILLSLLVIGLIASAFIVSPMYTAWSIREAVKSGDHNYLAKSIDWDSVRTTLTASLEKTALTSAESGQANGNDVRQRLSLWQRIKGWASRSMIQSFVASNVTPKGLPRLFGIGKTYRGYVHGEVEPERTLANLPERVRKFWARVKRAEYKSLTRFEIDFVDKYNPSRIYGGTLEFKGWGWRLTELRLRQLETRTAPARSAALL